MTFRIAQMPGYAPARVRPNDAEWWFAQARRYKWRFARTMPQAPHSYIWRGKEMRTADYDRLFGALRTFGQPGKYWDRTQLYLIDPATDARYWLMDRHYFTCTILNMADDGRTYGEQDAPITGTAQWSEYDEIAPWWDDVYREADETDLAALWRLVTRTAIAPLPTLLDLGAGTGGTLDARFAPSRTATVVDPSQGMLNDLVLKYPKVGAVMPMTASHYLGQFTDQFDVVTASFGSASYLTPQDVRAAHQRSRHLTLLSFYDALPTHRTEMPQTHAEALRAALDLPGAVSERRGSFAYVWAEHRT